MRTLSFPCQREGCDKFGHKSTGGYNRSVRLGMGCYCSRECYGLARRSDNRTPEKKKSDKAAYDKGYRAKNFDNLKAKKHEYFKRTYDPVKAAEHRKGRMPKHVEYCRRPEYREWKANYDKRYRANKHYGPFAEVAITLNHLDRELRSRLGHNEAALIRGTFNKSQQRKRDYERTNGKQPQIGTVGNPQLGQRWFDPTSTGGLGGDPGAGNPAHGQGSASSVQPIEAKHPRRRDRVQREVTTVPLQEGVTR